MSHAVLRPLLRLFWSTLIVGSAGLVALGVAIAIASSRYAQCGPSRLDAADAACRIGAQVLAGAYAVLSVALVLGAASLTVLWRLRRQQRARG